jgi:hypothetical protein
MSFEKGDIAIYTPSLKTSAYDMRWAEGDNLVSGQGYKVYSVIKDSYGTCVWLLLENPAVYHHRARNFLNASEMQDKDNQI